MTNPLKNYFVVIEKSHISKKELVFEVYFFYLKLYNEKKSSFSYISEPFFKGNVLFGLDIKNKMRPLKFSKKEKDGTIKPVNPRLFNKFILAKENKFIAFSKQTDLKQFDPILEMLKNFQYDKSKIKTMTFCKTCLENGKFNLLDQGNQIKSYKENIICSDCALELVLKQAELTGLLPSDRKINLKLKNFFKHMILKFRDVKKVLLAFKADFNPVKNKEITIYDVEKSPKISKKYLDVKVKDLLISTDFIMILENAKITTLLPIQAISIENGLLSEHKDQLIMAPTSGGKTLIGELAGVSKLFKDKKKKMLYLVPIVALANIRTDEFTKKYKHLKLKVVKRVGESLLEKGEQPFLEDLNDANIIVATYEAIDYILRSGNKEKLGQISTIVIDEIQVLIDPERGFLLDGFIARLKSIFQKSQYLYLSATIGEPKTLAKKLNCKLVQYNNRPVPIERHLLLCLNENMKHRNILKLIKSTYSQTSNYGYKGQSIVFTNTRKKCESISKYILERGMKVRAYHSGLTNEERKLIELEFQSQRISGVIATAALAAGVDLPASQVIFESLAMGIKWLTVAEFEQMLGRAGRLKKHDLGYAYLLVEPGKVYNPKMKITEENIAIRLLNGKIKDFELEQNENKSLTELLAYISMYSEIIEYNNIYSFYNLLINNNYELDYFIKKLHNLKLIRTKESLKYKPTHLGRS
ncbi:MAG: DEAD/DEAH box helicase, partial [Candidatus Hermodarchaeota archaeon]